MIVALNHCGIHPIHLIWLLRLYALPKHENGFYLGPIWPQMVRIVLVSQGKGSHINGISVPLALLAEVC